MLLWLQSILRLLSVRCFRNFSPNEKELCFWWCQKKHKAFVVWRNTYLKCIPWIRRKALHFTELKSCVRKLRLGIMNYDIIQLLSSSKIYAENQEEENKVPISLVSCLMVPSKPKRRTNESVVVTAAAGFFVRNSSMNKKKKGIIVVLFSSYGGDRFLARVLAWDAWSRQARVRWSSSA